MCGSEVYLAAIGGEEGVCTSIGACCTQESLGFRLPHCLWVLPCCHALYIRQVELLAATLTRHGISVPRPAPPSQPKS